MTTLGPPKPLLPTPGPIPPFLFMSATARYPFTFVGNIDETGPSIRDLPRFTLADATPSRWLPWLGAMLAGACITALVGFGLTRHFEPPPPKKHRNALDELAERTVACESSAASTEVQPPAPPTSTPMISIAPPPPPAPSPVATTPKPRLPPPPEPEHELPRVAEKTAEKAAEKAAEKTAGPAVPIRSYSVQVASLRTGERALELLKQLKAKAHRARIEVVDLEEKGIWYVVRIGPFADHTTATRYHARFDAAEGNKTVVVPKAR